MTGYLTKTALIIILLLFPHLSLADQGSVYVLESATTGKSSLDLELTRRSVDILQSRLAAFGEPHAAIEQRGNRRIILTLSRRASESADIVQQATRQSRLEFRAAVETADFNKIPPDTELLYENSLDNSGKLRKTPYLLKKKAELAGDIITAAEVAEDRTTGQTTIAITLNEEGTKGFADLSERMIGSRLAIVVDNNVISAPVIRSGITGGKLSISGRFTFQEAEDIATALNSNFLPASFSIISQRDAGVTLFHPPVNSDRIAMEETRLVRLKAEYDNAAKNAERMEQLHYQKLISQGEYDKAQASMEMASAAMREVRQQLKVLREAARPRVVAESEGRTETAKAALPRAVAEQGTVPIPINAPLDDNAVAIVIGIEKYQSLPSADYVGSDAAKVRDALKSMGYQDRNIEFLTNERATFSGIRKAVETWLFNRITPQSRVTVYFAGHGAPEPQSGEAYIVPYDGDPNYLKDTGYPLKRLYERLESLQAQQVVVFIDACFSGAGGRGVLAAGARSLVRVEKSALKGDRIAVLASTQGTQISTSSAEKKQGIFTYYLLQAFQAGKRDLVSAYEYLKPRVEDEAKRMNVEQTPLLSPDSAAIKGRFNLW